LRTRASLVVESGEPREVHHFALLLGYGASAVNPYLVFETLEDLTRSGSLPRELDPRAVVKNYLKAVAKGVVKVMSKMGISTIAGYRGAQIFEAVGLGRQVIENYFTHTSSPVEGIGLEELAGEQLVRHAQAYPRRDRPAADLEAGGLYKWRRDGEAHLFNPETIQLLQRAVRADDFQVFQEYSRRVDDQSKQLCTLRGLLAFRPRQAVPIAEVESVEELVKRFATGAMSYGSISREAHENLAIAMNRLGGRSNTGEGGEDPERFAPLPDGDSRCSAVKQVASARFGVTSEYLVNARELQIKIAQGAKPGEGGQLPADKVYPWIARTRHGTPHVGLISPPPHHDIYSIEDLAQLIYDLKCANPRARISVKLVAEGGVGTVAAGVAKARADAILISGHDGGTGASPLTSIQHAGGAWELGLAETQQTLALNGLRGRVTLQVDGQLKTGRDVVIAALLGAEEFGFATAALVAGGCLMMRVCHLDTCPVGVATQNPELRRRFPGRPEHVAAFMRFIAREVREHMAKLGFRRMDEMIGRVECLEVRAVPDHPKARGLDLSRILAMPRPRRRGESLRRVQDQDHGLQDVLDHQLLELSREALENGTPVRLELPIRNVHRAVGTLLGGELTRRHPKGLPKDTIRARFVGVAGQSFGAFLPAGLTLELEGEANDYLAKGLSGGRIIVYPPGNAAFKAEENVILGNVAAYGATGGELFVRGRAGERFCVRTSGAVDHGCEYMTGGRVILLGPAGRNFAAGMSGGLAFVFDEDRRFASRCNQAQVGLSPLREPEDLELVKELLERHRFATRSPLADRVLARWPDPAERFVKVYPHEYRRALEQERSQVRSGAVAG
jgi:glutamate synthase (ferredoxin)